VGFEDLLGVVGGRVPAPAVELYPSPFSEEIGAPDLDAAVAGIAQARIEIALGVRVVAVPRPSPDQVGKGSGDLVLERRLLAELQASLDLLAPSWDASERLGGPDCVNGVDAAFDIPNLGRQLKRLGGPCDRLFCPVGVLVERCLG